MLYPAELHPHRHPKLVKELELARKSSNGNQVGGLRICRLDESETLPSLALFTALIVRGFDLGNAITAFGVFGIHFSSVRTHLSYAGFILDRVALTRHVFAFALFVAACFADEVKSDRATAQTELVDDGFFQITAIAGVETLDSVTKEADA